MSTFTIPDAVAELKELGNAAFKSGDIDNALKYYTQAIGSKEVPLELKATLLTNRAACHLRLRDYSSCMRDCDMTLEISPNATKALYRKAVAADAISDPASAHKALAQLLHYDGKNVEAVKLMRKVKASLLEQQKENSEVKSVLDVIDQDSSKAELGLKKLIGLCYDDVTHALELLRKDGIARVCRLVNTHIKRASSGLPSTPIPAADNNVKVTEEDGESEKIVVAAVRLLSAASNHRAFVLASVDASSLDSVFTGDSFVESILNHTGGTSAPTSVADSEARSGERGKEEGARLSSTSVIGSKSATKRVSLASICSLLTCGNQRIIQPTVVLVMTILKMIPLELPNATTAGVHAGSDVLLSDSTVRAVLYAFKHAMRDQNAETFTVISESLSAFLSLSENYFDKDKDIDTRMESLEERKSRIHRTNLLSKRSKNHARLAIECGILNDFVEKHLDSENYSVRSSAASCIGRIVHFLDDDELLKNSVLLKYLVGSDVVSTEQQQQYQQRNVQRSSSRAQAKSQQSDSSSRLSRVVEVVDDEEDQDGDAIVSTTGATPSAAESKQIVSSSFSSSSSSSSSSAAGLPSVPDSRRRAELEAALLVSRPALGAWALQQTGGVRQLLLLISTGDLRCTEVAAEVMCLAASTEEGSTLLEPLVSSDALSGLLRCAHTGIRAAAASTMTKLSLKAKALTEDSAEVSHILNTVLAVLKAASKINSAADSGGKKNNNSNNNNNIGSSASGVAGSNDKSQAAGRGGKGKSGGTDEGLGNLVSFSALDDVSKHAQNKSQARLRRTTEELAKEFQSNSVTMTSIERAVEVLAALMGKTYVKEELVHGSFRVSSCIAEMMKLDLDVSSSAAYGVAHILSALTVTNYELRAKALAEKDITPEQYEQMQELQRIKTKDENGNVIEEKKEDADADTEDLCRRRIKRIVASDALPVLVKFLGLGSEQTREVSARALRQICTEESIRGQVIQQGALKACAAAATDEDLPKATRLEAAHAVAKTLVTTNPNLLSEHARLGTISPLLFLCKETDATNLQQFEALLSLTNILSCGHPEQAKFVAQKGVQSVHYLIFSDNLMVRRAATEVFCNMSTHDALLKILRQGDKLRLWLGICEDYTATVPAAAADDDADAAELEGEGDAVVATAGPATAAAVPTPTPVLSEREKAQAEREERELNEATFFAARAAAGTLAGAAGARDLAFVAAMAQEDCSRTLVQLLRTENAELVHRTLVLIVEMLSCVEEEENGDGAENEGEGGREKVVEVGASKVPIAVIKVAENLLKGGVVPAIGAVVTKMRIPMLGELAREAAEALSQVLSSGKISEASAAVEEDGESSSGEGEGGATAVSASS